MDRLEIEIDIDGKVYEGDSIIAHNDIRKRALEIRDDLDLKYLHVISSNWMPGMPVKRLLIFTKENPWRTNKGN